MDRTDQRASYAKAEEKKFRKFLRDSPTTASRHGAFWALNEIKRLRKRVAKLQKFTEILRTLLDERVPIEEFRAAVKAVTR